jgi:hypothetical protein
MDTLQLQDAFEPYYAERPHTQDQRPANRVDRRAETLSEVKARLEICRSRLARAIAASEAERP